MEKQGESKSILREKSAKHTSMDLNLFHACVFKVRMPKFIIFACLGKKNEEPNQSSTILEHNNGKEKSRELSHISKYKYITITKEKNGVPNTNSNIQVYNNG